LNFASRYSLFEMVANNIFQDFGSSDFAAHKRGVRVNLDAFLNNFYVSELLDPQDPSRSLLAEAFTTRHSTFGMASIQYPADRIKLAALPNSRATSCSGCLWATFPKPSRPSG